MNGVPNLAQVEPGICVWRGGQPTDAGWNYLAHAGVSNVVKLDLESEGSDVAARALGMRVTYAPISAEEQILGVQKGAVDRAVAAIGPGTLVHCLHGEDRTGLVVASYRVSKGWTKVAAEKEMLEHGFHKSLGGLWRYWGNE